MQPGRIGAASSRVDVRHPHRASGAAVALPEFHAAAAIVGDEVEGVADRCPVDAAASGELGAVRARSDVFHQHGAGGAAVGGPEFGAAGIGNAFDPFIEKAVAGLGPRQGPIGRKGLELNRARRGAIRAPQQEVASCIERREIEKIAHDILLARAAWQVGQRQRAGGRAIAVPEIGIQKLLLENPIAIPIHLAKDGGAEKQLLADCRQVVGAPICAEVGMVIAVW